MHALFSPLTDLGPSAINSSPSPLVVVHAVRSAGLGGEVRKLCPSRPGVYGMIDRHGELIYVGKAKCLRVRLMSYFRKRGVDRKAKRIIREARSLLWEANANEFAALHRELELIRRWRPRWNVQGQPLRRRVTHLCLGRGPAPYVFVARQPPKNVIAAYGPLSGGDKTLAAVQRINDLFQLRDCPQKEDVVFAGQTELFPIVRSAACLRHEIGTCLGPCAALCSEKDYDAKVRAAKRFLDGRDRTPLDQLETEMAAAAQAQQFERAANLRDRLVVLRWIWDRLERVRRARAEDHFIYPVSDAAGHTVWYLVHGGRTVTAVDQPATSGAARDAARLIKAVYQKNHAASLDAYEHVDGFLVVSMWFKRFPSERKRTIKPDEALRVCRNLAPASVEP